MKLERPDTVDYDRWRNAYQNIQPQSVQPDAAYVPPSRYSHAALFPYTQEAYHTTTEPRPAFTPADLGSAAVRSAAEDLRVNFQEPIVVPNDVSELMADQA